MDEREWFTQHPCPHCSHRASSNAELWVHRRTVHPAQEGLPVPEFRGRGNGEPSERDPRTYIYFGSNPPKSVLEYETKRMSLPSDIIRRKQDNFGVLDMSEAPPVVSVRSKYVKSTYNNEGEIAHRVELMKAEQAREKAQKAQAQSAEIVEQVLVVTLDDDEA